VNFSYLIIGQGLKLGKLRYFCLASTVVEHSPLHPKVKGLSPKKKIKHKSIKKDVFYLNMSLEKNVYLLKY
jgi:hypothetical protein